MLAYPLCPSSLIQSSVVLSFFPVPIHLVFLHVDDTTDAVTGLHVGESLVDLRQRLTVSDELVDLELAVHVVVNKVGQLSAALDTSESATLPDTASNELECCDLLENDRPWINSRTSKLTSGGDFLTSGSNTDDDALTPTLVAGLERAAHNVHISSAIESVVATTICHFNEFLLDRLVLELGRVDEIGRPKLCAPLLFAVVDIDDDDLTSTVLDTTLNDGETDTASAEDSDVGALLDTAPAGGDDCSAVTSCDTTAQQAGAVHWCLVGDGDDGDVGHNGVLRKGRGTHEVEKVFALALEARGSVRHDTLALGCANLAAKVGLAGLAELALLAFWGAV